MLSKTNIGTDAQLNTEIKWKAKVAMIRYHRPTEPNDFWIWLLCFNEHPTKSNLYKLDSLIH